jgi:hypothetical protein
LFGGLPSKRRIVEKEFALPIAAVIGVVMIVAGLGLVGYVTAQVLRERRSRR